MRYTHRVFRFDDGVLGQATGVIGGKRRFREAMRAHFESDGASRLAFQLENSPNTTVYEVIPYINRRGRLDVCFRALDDDAGT